jgi:hypothetical protein
MKTWLRPAASLSSAPGIKTGLERTKWNSSGAKHNVTNVKNTILLLIVNVVFRQDGDVVLTCLLAGRRNLLTHIYN